MARFNWNTSLQYVGSFRPPEGLGYYTSFAIGFSGTRVLMPPSSGPYAFGYFTMPTPLDKTGRTWYQLPTGTGNVGVTPQKIATTLTASSSTLTTPTAHPFVVGDLVSFMRSGGLGGIFVGDPAYPPYQKWVVATPTATSFKVANTKGGVEVISNVTLTIDVSKFPYIPGGGGQFPGGMTWFNSDWVLHNQYSDYNFTTELPALCLVHATTGEVRGPWFLAGKNANQYQMYCTPAPSWMTDDLGITFLVGNYSGSIIGLGNTGFSAYGIAPTLTTPSGDSLACTTLIEHPYTEPATKDMIIGFQGKPSTTPASLQSSYVSDDREVAYSTPSGGMCMVQSSTGARALMFSGTHRQADVWYKGPAQHADYCGNRIDGTSKTYAFKAVHLYSYSDIVAVARGQMDTYGLRPYQRINVHPYLLSNRSTCLTCSESFYPHVSLVADAASTKVFLLENYNQQSTPGTTVHVFNVL